MQSNWYEAREDPEPESPDGTMRAERTAFTEPPVQATIYHERKPVEWRQVAPYLVAFLGAVIAAAALFMFLGWRGQMQQQVSQLRREVALAQSQAAAGDAGLSSSLSGLSRNVSNLRSGLSAVSAQIGPFSSQCTAPMTGPAGLAVYVTPCRR
jgi:hypothetical protein